MKRSSTHLLLLVTLLVLTASCNNSTETTQEEVSTPTDSYDPGPNWKLAWADEFDRDSLDGRNWTYQIEPAGRFNDEWQRYTSSTQNAYIDNECLVIKAIHESDAHGMDQYTSARLHTANKHTWTYGKIAARIKLPKGQGIWPAFWMLGSDIDTNPWPAAGEIDIMELRGQEPSTIAGSVHGPGYSGGDAVTEDFELEDGRFDTEFHVFAIEWGPDFIDYYVDDELYQTITPESLPIDVNEGVEGADEELCFPVDDDDCEGDPMNERWVFNKDFFLLLNVAVGGDYVGNPTDDQSRFPQTMIVDYVRVYQ